MDFVVVFAQKIFDTAFNIDKYRVLNAKFGITAT